ncbi:MAG: 6-bladed beta-propeller [Bacteroidales bacterium]|nr:6-bladed beta-propeller [Bacteroidales bacterium]
MKYTVSIFILLIFKSCGLESGYNHLPKIDLDENIQNISTLNLSSIAKKIEYIPIETQSPLGEIRGIMKYQNIIFVYGIDFCKTYDTNGVFIHDIGNKGNGPGEYANIGKVSVNITDQLVYISSNNKIHVYSFDGAYLNTIDTPTNICFTGQYIGKNKFVSILPIFKGNEKNRLYFFDSNGLILDSSSNRISYIKKEPFFSQAEMGQIIYGFDRIHFKDGINDTLYYIDENLKIVPEYLLKFGKFKIPPEVFNNSLIDYSQKASEYISITDITDSENFLFITFDFHNHYPFENITKENIYVFGRSLPINETRVAVVFNKKTLSLTLLKGNSWLGFNNDIDGGLPFWPSFIDHKKNEMYSWFNAFEIINFFNEEHTHKGPYTDSVAHQRLIKLVKDLKTTDNPVIVKVTGLI